MSLKTHEQRHYSLDELTDILTILGLEEDEAAAYVHLAVEGPLKASDLARILKIHRTEAYRRLQRLADEGLASPLLGRPAKFAAVSPQRVFRELRGSMETRLRALRRAQDEFGPALASLGNQVRREASGAEFTTLRDRKTIHKTLTALLRDCTRSACVANTHDSAFSLAQATGFFDLAAERAAEGVDVRLLLGDLSHVRSRISSIPRLPGPSFRQTDEPRTFSFALIDGRTALVWIVIDPSQRLAAKEDAALLTNASGIVGLMASLFDRMWIESRSFEATGARSPESAASLDRGEPLHPVGKPHRGLANRKEASFRRRPTPPG